MDIIALKGNANSGKSETLNIVYQFLLRSGFTQVPGHFRVLGNPAQRDFLDIVERNSMKIGIATMGDYQKYLKGVKEGDIVQDLLKYLESNGCTKAICACNSKLNLALSYIQNHQHVLLEKTETSILAEQRVSNGEDAELIFSHL